MKKRTKVGVVVLAIAVTAFLAIMCAGAIAANPTDVSVSLTVPSTLQLDMPTTAVAFGTLQPGDSSNGVISATINSNKAWSLKVTKSDDMTGAVSGEKVPNANLTFVTTSANPNVTVKGSGTFGTGTLVCSGTRGSSITSTITYSVTVPWDLAPDTYTATHTYTATQP
jgi:hypothetical protein